MILFLNNQLSIYKRSFQMPSSQTILLYYMEKTKEKQIRQLCKKLSITVKTVQRADYSQSLGYLAGIEGFARKNAVYLGNELPAEMLVFSGMTSEQIDLFLADYRKMGISPIACKAVITPVNIFWDAGNLAEELLKEHHQLHKDPGICNRLHFLSETHFFIPTPYPHF